MYRTAIRTALAGSLIMATSGCLSPYIRAEYHELARAADAPPASEPAPAGRKRAGEAGEDDDALARGAQLPTILRIALRRNPDLAEAWERLQAALQRVPAASRLPDLEFKYEQWGIPLARPYALNEAQTLMFGLRQTFPAPGSLRARARVALEEAGMSLDAQHARQLDIIAQVRRAYYAFYRADREYRIHLEHVRIAGDIVDLARANYRVGRGTQPDVLRVVVELSKLHDDVAAIEQQLISGRALLNTLMARAPDAPLGPPPDFQPSEVQPRLSELERLVETRRPELLSAVRATRRSEAALAAARSTAYWPGLMVGADYWYMPRAEAPMPAHAYSAMVSINLPWLNPRHREEVREAEHTLAADRKALESARNVSMYQVRDAAARLGAARRSLAIIDRDLLPQALQSFEATRAVFSAGQGNGIALLDAFRSYLQVRLERVNVLARLESSLADLERTAGIGMGQEAEGKRP